MKTVLLFLDENNDAISLEYWRDAEVPYSSQTILVQTDDGLAEAEIIQDTDPNDGTEVFYAAFDGTEYKEDPDNPYNLLRR